MHALVDQMPRPDPDYGRFLNAVRLRPVDRVPLIELAVHPRIVNELLDDTGFPAGGLTDSATATARSIALLHRLGYDVAKVSAHIPFRVDRATSQGAATSGVSDRQWQDQYKGPIESMQDFEAFLWPDPAEIDFGPVEEGVRALPDGMRMIGFAGGVLEFALDLVGLERFMFAVYDAPDLLEAVLERVGRIVFKVFESYCQIDAVCAVWLGDDLGGKNGLLVSPEVLETHVFPWYRRYVELAHSHDRPFLLHSCGKTESVMPTLIEDVRIDAKHSFEDAIEPVESFIDRWGTSVAVLGGIDLNLLAMGNHTAVRRRVNDVLDHVATRGGYACGSGNSIPDYVPAANYLAMIEETHRFNGRM